MLRESREIEVTSQLLQYEMCHSGDVWPTVIRAALFPPQLIITFWSCKQLLTYTSIGATFASICRHVSNILSPPAPFWPRSTPEGAC